MTLINKIEFQNGGLHTKNTCIGITIFFIYAISAIPISAALYVASFHIFGYEAISKITSKLPEFMHIFTGATIACLVMTAILTGYALYHMNQNSEKIGENNYKARIVTTEKNQTISYLSEESSSKGEVYVKLKKKYPGGCIIKSDSGKKFVTLKYIPEEGNNGHIYEVIGYQNISNSAMTKEDFQEDFFERNKTQRRDVSIYSISPAILVNIVINLHSQKERS